MGSLQQGCQEKGKFSSQSTLKDILTSRTLIAALRLFYICYKEVAKSWRMGQCYTCLPCNLSRQFYTCPPRNLRMLDHAKFACGWPNGRRCPSMAAPSLWDAYVGSRELQVSCRSSACVSARATRRRRPHSFLGTLSKHLARVGQRSLATAKWGLVGPNPHSETLNPSGPPWLPACSRQRVPLTAL
jgi:hypothetical protein